MEDSKKKLYKAIQEAVRKWSKSAVADNAVQNNHVINWQEAKVLCKECNTR